LTIALAYLKYGFFEPGSRVEVETESVPIAGLVAELPFYRAI
jgi:glycine cleavage system aminomethyltransferase T